MRLLFVAAALVFAVPAGAQLYTCKTADGALAGISSKPVPGQRCELQQSHERVNNIPSSSSRPVAAPVPAPAAKPAAPAAKLPISTGKTYKGKGDFPSVSLTQQRQRDKTRGNILRYELEREIKRQRITALQIEEEKAKAGDDISAALLAHLEKQLVIHSNNITSIRQELDRL